MKYLILLAFLISLVGGCATSKAVTDKTIREVGKDLQPGQRLIYRRIAIEETLEIIRDRDRVINFVPRPKKKEREEAVPDDKKVSY